MTSRFGDTEAEGVWKELAAPLNPNDLAWRIDSKPTARDGKFFARFVVYVEAGTVRDRLDSVVAGNWDLTLELLPSNDIVSREAEVTGRECSFKARLQILGVIREDIGTGKDYKQASTDAFKRAAVRFGIGHELYAFEQNWVEVDGDGKYARAVEDPQKAYERRHTSGANNRPSPDNPAPGVAAGGALAPATETDERLPNVSASCPKCGGRMWDNRLTKRNAKAPDYKCQNRSCDGCIWPPKAVDEKRPVATGKAREEDFEDFPGALEEMPDNLPF